MFCDKIVAAHCHIITNALGLKPFRGIFGQLVRQFINTAGQGKEKAFRIGREDIPNPNEPGSGIDLTFSRSSGPGGQNVNKCKYNLFCL